MFRERQLASIPYVAGQTQRARLPNDAVYHLLQLAIYGGTITSVGGIAATGPVLESNFPFSLIRDMRIIRNGSDVVWQGSGAQLAKEHFYLNNSNPKARLYTVASNVETLITGATRSVTIPASSAGIGANLVNFVGNITASDTAVTYFDMQMEMWFQLNLDGKAATETLVDARKLATFDIEVTWADVSSIMTAGTTNTSNTVACNLQVLSVDQDNVSVQTNFGTFKRAAFQYSNFTYNSSNNQIMLSRGNFWYGMIFQTRAYKAASTVIPRPENNVLGNIQNRFNTNFLLRVSSFRQLQAKNNSDNGGRHNIYDFAEGYPQGFAAIQYCSALDNPGELIASYVADVFDLQVDVQASTSASNGATTGSTSPIIDILTQEVIPGVTVAPNAPQGSQAGSLASVSAKPYVK